MIQYERIVSRFRIPAGRRVVAMRRFTVIVLPTLLAGVSPANATPSKALRAQSLAELTDLTTLQSVAANPTQLRRTAERIASMITARGLTPQLLESADGKAPPLIFAEWSVPDATRTLILYAHYDAQPVAEERWRVTKPFLPLLLNHRAELGGKPVAAAQASAESRLYGRGAADDKAGVVAILNAVSALKARGTKPSFNFKFVFQGDEEASSRTLPDLLRRHRDTLKSDGWILVDGPADASGAPQLALGVRGVAGATITVFGADTDLHSGHYGNWAPNPAMALARLLSSMKDADGRVRIAGFYDDVLPLSSEDAAAVAAMPVLDERLKETLHLGGTDGAGARLAELINQPSLNIDGIRSADVGTAARKIIPSQATATIDMRLVLGNDHQRQFAKMVAHIRAQGYFVIDRAPTPEERLDHPLIAQVTSDGGYNAERVPVGHPLARDIEAAIGGRRPPVVVPTLGSSLPLHILRDELGVPSVTLAMWNHDDNQHSDDENLRLGNLWDAIDIIDAIMTMK